MFGASMDMTTFDAAELREAILEAVPRVDVMETDLDEFGRRFVADFTPFHRGRSAEIRTAWTVRRGEESPRLTNCYVL